MEKEREVFVMPWSPEAYHRLEKEFKNSKIKKEETLESQKEDLENSYKQSEYQQKIREEMDKIRKEGKIKDWRKVIYEAEKRIEKENK